MWWGPEKDLPHRKEVLGGQLEPSYLREQAGQAAALGCAATAEDAPKVSSLHPQDSCLLLPLFWGSRVSSYLFSKMNVREDKCSQPHTTGYHSGRIFTAPLPYSPG